MVSDFIYFILGLLLGAAIAYVISFYYLLKNHQLQESQYSQSREKYAYSIDEVWDFLTNTQLITCYKAYHFAGGYKQANSPSIRRVSGRTVISDKSGDLVYINLVAEKNQLNYGESPFESTHFFSLHKISEHETLVDLRQGVTPEEFLRIGFFNKLISSLIGKKIYQPEKLAEWTLENIRRSL